MKVAIIGAGAMGCIYGGYLAQDGNDVVLVDVWEEHVNKINQDGLTIYKNGKIQVVDVKATTNPDSIKQEMDLIIIFVKSYHTRNAIKSCDNLVGNSTKILTLQNGIGNAETIFEFVDKAKILAGTTNHGANVKGPGEMNHAGEGKTVIGRIDNSEMESDEKAIVDAFNSANLETYYECKIQGVIWDKILVNVGINALTAILEIKNGELLDYDETEELLELLVQEAYEIAEKADIEISLDQPIEYVKSIAKATAENRSSMFQDIQMNRKTEIDYINGGVVRKGEQFGLDAPYNKFVTLMVKAKEKKNQT